jgi:hypothetical protein
VKACDRARLGRSRRARPLPSAAPQSAAGKTAAVPSAAPATATASGPASSAGFARLRPRTYLMPARMKLCTNWRWNSRKATSSGPDVIKVAAVMMDQSTP